MRHISISGDIGSGKSSVSRLLSELLGCSVVSAGHLQRRLAEAGGLSILQANRLAEKNGVLDNLIDNMIVQRATHNGCKIFDSRLAWYLVPSSFKVHLIVDPDVAAARILEQRTTVTESYGSLAEAAKAIEQRYNSERERFIVRYGIDISSLKNYDLILDTTDASPALIAGEIISGVRHPRSSVCSLRISPHRILLPSYLDVDQDALPAGLHLKIPEEVLGRYPIIHYKRPRLILLSGSAALDKAIKANQQLVPAFLVSEAAEPSYNLHLDYRL